MESKVESRFGRGRYFIFVDPDTLEFEAIENPGVNAMGGAGTQAAQLVAQKAEVVITGGNFGPKAAQALSSFGVKMIGGFSGTVREAVEKYKNGELKGEDSFGASSLDSVSGSEKVENEDFHKIKKDAKNLSSNIEEAKERIDKLMGRK